MLKIKGCYQNKIVELNSYPKNLNLYLAVFSRESFWKNLFAINESLSSYVWIT